MPKAVIIVIAAAAALGLVLYLWVGGVTQHAGPTDFPTEGPREPIVLADTKAMKDDIANAVNKVHLPSHPAPVAVRELGPMSAADKRNLIVENLAFPAMQGRFFVGVVSLRCDPRETCGKDVKAPSQIGWTPGDVEDFRNRTLLYLQTLERPIEDADPIYEVTWRTDSGEHFITYMVTSKTHPKQDGGVDFGRQEARFESMLYFSPVRKRCDEKASTLPGETSLTWDGDVHNGLGMRVVSWKGDVTFRFQGGHMLPGELCVNRSCLTYTHEPLWGVDDKRTQVNAGKVNKNSPDDMSLDYTIAWYGGIPIKLSGPNGAGVELQAPAGNAVAGRFTLRADGTWNKEH